MKISFLFLLIILCACQSHRQRYAVQRDSIYLQKTDSLTALKKLWIQAGNRQQSDQQTASETLIIFPLGTVSYHADSGFRGQAAAILVQHARSLSRVQHADSVLLGLESRTTITNQARETYTAHMEKESVTEREPASGFSFRWLAIALLSGCVLIVLVVFLRRARPKPHYSGKCIK